MRRKENTHEIERESGAKTAECEAVECGTVPQLTRYSFFNLFSHLIIFRHFFFNIYINWSHIISDTVIQGAQNIHSLFLA